MATRWNEDGENTNVYQQCNGLGWDMAEYISCEGGDVKVIGKGGDLSNQHACLMVAPDEKISVSVLSAGGDSAKNELLCRELMKIVLEDKGIKVETTSEDEIVFEDTVPEEYKNYEGYYYMSTMGGSEVVYISFEDDSLYMDHVYKDTDEKTSQSANHQIQSAKMGVELPSKCKNCTLEEVAVLRIIHENRSATQKEIAAAIGKSERTVKSITVALQEKLIIKRVNGKRDGYWEFVE